MPSGQGPGSVRVQPVSSRADLRRFIDVPWQVYAGDPAWVPPLRLERRLHLSALNPFLAHGAWQGWVATRDHRPVGRISAQIDELHRQRYSANTGHFGMLEAGDDRDVFTVLFAAAEGWLRERGTRHVTGPFNFSINQECGLLIGGFDTPPSLLMPHGRPWYAARVEEQGYVPVKDLLAYWVRVDFEAPRVMSALLKRFAPRLRVRTLCRPHLRDELRLLRDIFNDAWSENWGFVPFTEAEFAELGQSLRLFVDDRLVQIAELDGVPAAFIVALPNLNEVLAGLDGSLFPLGWARLLWRLKRREIRTGRVALMGVRRSFQNRPLGMALAFQVIDAVRWALRELGIGEVEMSWILEENKGMRNILDCIGSKPYKRYRIYEKQLRDGA
ncbi:MAG: N-acetyltransferase [Gammaproteobacteria bacterium]|nr:N-acetyltransferase [Gammaproteobacteria bacterium]